MSDATTLLVPIGTEVNAVCARCSVLPPTIGRLTRLVTFDMSYNQLEAIPTEIGQCVRLSTLDLQHNKLAELPETIGNLRQLTRIGLR